MYTIIIIIMIIPYSFYGSGQSIIYGLSVCMLQFIVVIINEVQGIHNMHNTRLSLNKL